MSATSGSGFLLSVRLLVSVAAVALAHALIRLFVSIFSCPVVSGRAWFLVFQCCRVLGASLGREVMFGWGFDVWALREVGCSVKLSPFGVMFGCGDGAIDPLQDPLFRLS